MGHYLSRDFIHYSEGYYFAAKQADRDNDSALMERAIVSSIVFSWIAIEAFINNMMADFTTLSEDTFSLHERSLLTEKTVEFIDSGADAGKFRLSNRTEYRKIEDKILFLIAKFGGGSKLDKGGTLWQKFIEIKKKRDQITHPRKANDLALNLQDAEDALGVAKSIIKIVSEKVWGEAVDL
ncbi:MAG: hypothetical protein HZB17_12530 [Chloroflexi bacterium]|nr:hypothetical protein [Chloroflexota bacterium]